MALGWEISQNKFFNKITKCCESKVIVSDRNHQIWEDKESKDTVKLWNGGGEIELHQNAGWILEEPSNQIKGPKESENLKASDD